MKNVGPIHILAAIILAVAAHGQRKEPAFPSDYPYSPAFISTVSAPPGHTQLVVFPLHGKAFAIPIHSLGAPITFEPGGKALYGQCTPNPEVDNNASIQIGFCRTDLKTGLTTPAPGTMHPFRSNTTRREHATFSPFGFLFPSGKPITIILQHPDKFPWEYVSLSPDGERAVGTHRGQVEIINIARGTTEPLGDRLFIAEWSPDGRWLAAVEMGERGRTILMDASDLKPRRILGNSDLDWSPDSHYLLGVKTCSAYYGTLEAINVETGERTAIKNSKCQINQATTGWVSNDIAER